MIGGATENERILLQAQLDAAKTQTSRNKLGQFATPTMLATEIVQSARPLLPSRCPIRFLDPAFGTGSFYSALLRQFPVEQIVRAVGYEIDPHYGSEAIAFWKWTSLQLNIADFLTATPPNSCEEKANLVIANPPYSRHHHLHKEKKRWLQWKTEQIAGIKLSGLAGLYCYFLCISDAWMTPGGLAGWLIPSGFMDVNYGQPIKDYLLNRVTLLRVHRFEPKDVQFKQALVSSSFLWFRKALPPVESTVEFTYGGSLGTPNYRELISAEVLRATAKWTQFGLVSGSRNDSGRLGLLSPPNSRENKSLGEGETSRGQSLKLRDLLTIKRGLATGANPFFLLTPELIERYELPPELLVPVLPSPRFLTADEIETDPGGNPLIERQLFLLKCHLPEEEVRVEYPSVWKYLQLGRQWGISDRYLCRHRTPWYAQENREPSPFLCTYMGRQDGARGRAFRFILNHSKATATNVYLMMYPQSILAETLARRPELVAPVWQALNQLSDEMLRGEGRVYGGGLHKLEPRELGNAPAGKILEVLPI